MSENDKKILIFGAGAVLGFFVGQWITQRQTPTKMLNNHGLKYLAKVIEEWRPVRSKKESDYQISLQNYLLGRFSDDELIVDREYGIGSSRVDIVIERKYAIELKLDLKDESEIKRLKSQVSDMEDHFHSTLVVLCGNTQERVINELRRAIRRYDEDQPLIPWGEGHELVCDVIVVPDYS